VFVFAFAIAISICNLSTNLKMHKVELEEATI
jgi:hypothetical protein